MDVFLVLIFLHFPRLITTQPAHYSLTNKNIMFFKAKSNFDTKILRVTSISSFAGSTQNCSESCEIFRFSFEVIDFLAEYLNFSYTLVEPEDNTFGIAEVINGTAVWNGMIGMLVNEKADLAAGLFFITDERKKVIDFSVPVLNEEIGLITLSPQEIRNHKGLLAPLHRNVWIIIIITSCLMVLLIYGCLRLDRWLKKDQYPKNSISLSSCIWFVYSGLVKQGAVGLPQTNLARILFATWWFFSLLLTSIYSANLAAYLTLPTFHIVEDLDDVLKNPNIKWIIQYGHVLDGAIQNPTSDLFYKLHASMMQGSSIRVNSTEEAILLLLQGNYVYFQEVSSLKQVMFDDYRKTGRCRFVMSPYTFFNKEAAFGFAKGNSYIQHLNFLIYSLRATGMIEKWFKTYIDIPEVCRLSSDVFLRDDDRKLNLLNLSTAFYILASGLSLGLMILLIEIFPFRKRKITIRSDTYIVSNNVSGKKCPLSSKSKK